MEVITNLIAQGFSLFNVDKVSKLPVKRDGNGMGSWQELPVAVLQKHHNMKSTLWGMRMGKQENGRYIMSLDFDTCGKDRTGCDYTKQKLAEYASIVDKEDGWYHSSTVGNENVLVDYTNTPEIIRLMEDAGSKWAINAMEVLIGNKHQQVIPPAATVCKINGRVMQPRTFKNDKIFYELTKESPIYPFILQLYTDYKNTKKEKEPKTTVPKKQENKNEEAAMENTIEPENKWVDLLMNVIGNDLDAIDYDSWLSILTALKCNKYDKSVFMKWTKIAEKDKGKLVKASDAWDKMDKNKNYSLGVLCNVAEKLNMVGYLAWRIKYNEFIQLETLNKGENTIAKEIAGRLRSDLIFSNGKWYMFDKKIGIWRTVKNPHSVVITHIQHRIDESVTTISALKEKESDEDKRKTYADIIKKYNVWYRDVSKAGTSSQIITVLQTELFDNSFESTLDLNPYKIAYKNGILDLNTLQFRKELYSADLLTQTIPYDYEKAKPEDVAFVRHELLKICNNNPAHLEFYLSSIGYALTGDATKIQAFWCLRGQKASNGKSVIFEALQGIIPNYVVKLENNIFETTYGSRHKEISSWRTYRIAWVNELSKKKQDADVIKNVADGTTERFKVNYAGMDTMPIRLKAFIVTNITMQINADEGITRRMRVMQFDSMFSSKNKVDDYENCEFKVDTAFNEKLQTKYKFAMMELLFEYSKKFVDDGYKLKPYPADWAGDTEELCVGNNVVRENIEHTFEFAADAKMNKSEMEYQFGRLNISKNHFKDVMKVMGKKVTYDSQKKYKKCLGVWFGIKLKEVEKEDVAVKVAEEGEEDIEE
jgi:hypothetical protein